MELLYVPGRKGKWGRHKGKQHGDSSKILRRELLYDPRILVLSMYPKELKIETPGICTPMCTTRLFTGTQRGSNLSVHPQMDG